jgi:hypothetical protein
MSPFRCRPLVFKHREHPGVVGLRPTARGVSDATLFTPGVNRVSSGRRTTGCGRPGTPTLSLARADSSHTGSADSRRLATEGVGPHSTHVCGAREARVIGCPREGVNRADVPRGTTATERATSRNRVATTRWRVGAPVTGPQDAPERGSKPAPPTSGEAVLKPTGNRPGSLCVGKPRRSRPGGCHLFDDSGHRRRGGRGRTELLCEIILRDELQSL